MFCKRHHVRPPIQEPSSSSSFFCFPVMISYQFHVLGGDDGKLKMALILFPTWSAVALAAIWAQHSHGVCNVDASGWEEEVAVG